jgi:hypothetical protein
LLRIPTTLVLACVIVGCGPIAILPGGKLSGAPEPPPTNWGFSDPIDTVQLETRPDDPYSVNIWGVGIGEHFYVAAGDASSTWVQGIAENPDVRLKIGDSLFELRAVRTDSEAEIDAFLIALKKKYDFDPEPDQRSEATVFRLEARSSAQ